MSYLTYKSQLLVYKIFFYNFLLLEKLLLVIKSPKLLGHFKSLRLKL